MDQDVLAVVVFVGIVLGCLAFVIFLLWVVVKVVRHAWAGSGANRTEVEMRLNALEYAVTDLVSLPERVQGLSEQLSELERRVNALEDDNRALWETVEALEATGDE